MNMGMGTEPVRWFVGGGTALVQAILQLLIALGVPISTELNVAITTVAGLLLAEYTRAQVTPMATLPPGVAGQIADASAARAVEAAKS